jgi:hypothetical protein
MKDRCQKEIVELHQFFQDWFTRALPASDESFARVAGVLSEDFVLIGPDGTLTEQAPLREGLRAGYGSRPHFRIWIENYRFHWQKGQVGLATYEEWQELAGGITTRLSTALFREKEGNPNGLEWLHVHETWLEK